MQILNLVERAKALGPVDINGTLCHLTDTLAVSQDYLTVLIKAKLGGSDKWASYHVHLWPTWENGSAFMVLLMDAGDVKVMVAMDILLDVEAYVRGMLQAS